MKARRLSKNGVKEFAAYLANLRLDPTLSPPLDLLTSSTASDPLSSARDVPEGRLATKREAATAIVTGLGAEFVRSALTDVGLWSWLSLLYFDSLCPSKGGRRAPNASCYYVLDPDNSWRSYRHLLATACRLFVEVPDHNRLFLDIPTSVHGDVLEQIVGRLYLARIPAVRALIERLYWDPKTGKAKVGIVPKTPKPGDLRNRLWARIRQLELVYDIPSLDEASLLEKLGGEFSKWAR